MTDPTAPNADKAPEASAKATPTESETVISPDASAPTKESQQPQESSTDAPVLQKRSAATKILWLVILVFVLLIAGLSAAGYQAWLWYQGVDAQFTQLQTEAEKNSNALKSVKSELVEYGQGAAQTQRAVQAELKKSLQQNKNVLVEQNEVLTQMGERLNGQQTRINTLSTTSREDWLLAEAEYLLRLANQRVLLERNAQNAIALLEAADAIVKQVAAGLGDPELFAIRKALGRELTQLRLIENTDKEGLYIQLASLADEVEHLPRVRPTALNVAKPGELIEVGEQANTAEGWGSAAWASFKKSAGVLTQYIKISDTKTPAVPLMSNEDALVIAMNVRLLMQQAQLALLKEEPKIYKYSLEKVLQLINAYYIDSVPVEEYTSRIEQHLATNIAPDMPDISESLKLLNGFIKKLHKLEG